MEDVLIVIVDVASKPIMGRPCIWAPLPYSSNDGEHDSFWGAEIGAGVD